MKSAWAGIQLEKLNRLLDSVWERNSFYTRKWREAGVNARQLSSLEDLAKFPFTTRDELLADQNTAPPLGSNLTCAPPDYKHIHHSSGTTRAPLFWADTTQSWQWVVHCSQALYELAGIESKDRIFFAMPLGASSGGWILHEGAVRLGCCCFTAGQAEATELLRWIQNFQPNVLIGKPSRLLALAIAAQDAGTSPRSLNVQKLLLTGEPSRQMLRPQLEELWGAECFDRYGLTEAGSVACECSEHLGGMHVLESEFLVEVIDPATTNPANDGEPGELVLTNLGRFARPIIRYRTGDCVRLLRQHRCRCGRTGAFLQGDVARCTMKNDAGAEPCSTVFRHLKAALARSSSC